MKLRKRYSKTVINNMNVVPYIDVMLVLLVIFMVTAPMFVPGVINLPSVAQAATINTTPLQIIVDSKGGYNVITGGDNKATQAADINNLIEIVQGKAREDTPIVISADKDIRYNQVIDVVNRLYKAGLKKVALVVKNEQH